MDVQARSVIHERVTRAGFPDEPTARHVRVRFVVEQIEGVLRERGSMRLRTLTHPTDTQLDAVDRVMGRRQRLSLCL